MRSPRAGEPGADPGSGPAFDIRAWSLLRRERAFRHRPGAGGVPHVDLVYHLGDRALCLAAQRYR